ncbi:MAG: uracil-DNA glycosylase [Alphaproteobacteria bacterium]|nr:uracil-DNA glycosylase [Alphaproteobacteria bacterium]
MNTGPDMDRDQALALLRWYAEVGVDEAVTTDPVDRFAIQPQPVAPQAVAPPSAVPVLPPVQKAVVAPAPIAHDSEVRVAAAAANTHDELITAIHAFDGCPLKRTATTTCIFDGNPQARIMVIGEAPGGEEDRQGKPFVGPAGQLLDKMLAAIGLDRSTVYITNTLYWRPPGNRTPTPEEIALCLPFLERQVALIAPAVLLYTGGTAAKAMLNRSEGITRLRGRWFSLERNGREPIPAMAMFHPAYLLRRPELKRDAWRDLLAIRAKIDELQIQTGATRQGS